MANSASDPKETQVPRSPYGYKGQTEHNSFTVDRAQMLAEYAPVFPLTSYFLGRSKKFQEGDKALNLTDRRRWLPVQQQAASLFKGAISKGPGDPDNKDQQIQQLFAPIEIDESYNVVIDIDAGQFANQEAVDDAIKGYMQKFSWQIEEVIHKKIQATSTMTVISSGDMNVSDLDKIQFKFNQNGLQGKKIVAFYAPNDYSSLIELLSKKEYDSSRTTSAIEQYKVPNLLANMESYQQGCGVLLPSFDVDTAAFVGNRITSYKTPTVIPDMNTANVSGYESKQHVDNNPWYQFPSTYRDPGDLESGYRDNRFARVAFTYAGPTKVQNSTGDTSKQLTIPAGSRFTVGSMAKAVNGFTKQTTMDDMQFTLTENLQPTSAGTMNAQGVITAASSTQWMTISPCPINETVVPAGKDLVGVGLSSAYQNYSGEPNEDEKYMAGCQFLNTKSITPSYFLTPDSVMVVSASQEMLGDAGWRLDTGYTESGFPVNIFTQGDMDAMDYRIKLLCNFGVSVMNPQECLCFLANQKTDLYSNAVISESESE